MMGRLAALPLEAFFGPVADNAAQPGAKFLRFAQEPEMFPGRDERFLGHVLALPDIANPAVSQRANQYLVARYNPVERLPVAAQRKRHQFRIAVVFHCRHCFVCHHNTGYVPPEAKEVTKNRKPAGIRQFGPIWRPPTTTDWRRTALRRPSDQV